MQLLLRSIRIWGALCVLLFSLAVSSQARSRAQITQAVNTNVLVTLHGNTHPLAQAKFDQGLAPDSLPMNHMLLLLKRDSQTEKALEARIQALHNTTSPSYHKWLTPGQYQDQFGVATADIQALKNWLSAQGFRIDKLSAGGTVIEFSGTAGGVRSAFHTEIHQYKVNGVQHWANSSDPKVPSAIAPAISGFVSLHNFERTSLHRDLGVFHFSKDSKTWKKVSDATPSTTSTKTGKVTAKPNYTVTDSSGSTWRAVGPGDFNTIYNVKPLWDAGIDGTGQEIAIIGRSAITTGDIDQFRAAFGLPATNLKIVQDGQMPDHTSSEGEALLDIEWSGAVAKNATIDYVVAASTDSTDGVDLASLYAVDNNVAPILSVSYGMCELGLGTSGNAFYNELWRQAVAQGITVLIATGDGSAATCDQGYSDSYYGLTVNGIASTPYNIAVGGTDFNDFGGPNGVKHADYWSNTNDPVTRASALSYIPEMVWNDSCANNQLYPYLGFTDGESLCNNDTAYLDGLLTVAGGGGGISSCTVSSNADPSTCTGGYDKPAWQNTAGVPDDGKRDIPDVSLFAADGVTGSFYLYCMSSNTPSGTCNYDNADDIDYMGAGGTSFATPAFAGVMALVNQKTAQRQGNANYILYSLARSQFGTMTSPLATALSACSSDLGSGVGTSCVYRDVVTGDNAVPCINGSYNCTISYASDSYGVTSGYNATAGFDPATGLGSVNAANLVNNWSSQQLATTTTTLIAAPTTGTYGTTVSYTITVAPKSGTGSPTGTVILLANNSTITSGTLSDGKVSGTINSLVAGQYSLTAGYVSDGLYASSTSNAVSVNFTPAASSTTLAINEVNPITGATRKTSTIHYGSTPTATATVTGVNGLAMPSGTVNLNSTGTDSHTASLSTSGTASAALAQLAVGASENVTAAYSGDSNYAASSSAAQTISVVKAATAVRVASSTGYQVGTGTVTFTATAYSYSSGDKPTGNISLYINGTKFGTVAGTSGIDSISSSPAVAAQFIVPATSLTAGANTITVTYEGNGNYEAATSTALTIGYGDTVPVNAVTLTATPSTVSSQDKVALRAAVTTGSIPANAGSVTFYEGTKALGTVQVVRVPASSSISAGTATFYTRLAPGVHSITANYSGIGANAKPVTSSAVELTVTGTASSRISLTAAANSIHTDHYDFTATVTGNGIAAPAGMVSVNETSTIATLATATPDTSTASITYGNDQVFSLSDVAEYLATGDLNNDGIPDVVIRKVGTNHNYLEVFIGKGNGSYNDPVEYVVGTASRGHQIVITDLNGDGIPDVATVNQGDATVSILLGNGDGTLQPAYTVSTQSSPLYLYAADVNHDGITDLLFISIGGSNVGVARGNGDGTFQDAIFTDLDILPEYPAFADINHDGNLDIVYTSMIDFPSMLHVALGNGDGTFTVGQTFALPDSETANSIKLGDVDGDGNLDAVVSGYYSGNVSVAKGDGQGNFGTAVTYIAGTLQPYIKDAVAVDINGDGKLDIVALDAINSVVNILYNNGDGTFGAPTGFYPTILLASELYVADMNGDGVPDLLQTSQVHGDTQAALLFGGTSVTVKMRDVATDGTSDQLQQGVATFAGDAHYQSSTSSSVTFYGDGKLATPQILWAPSTASWGKNVPLGTGILDATTYGNIAGTFVYTAQTAGGTATTVIPTSSLAGNGTYVLTVTFTPADSSSYTTATAQQTITVIDPDFTLQTGTTGALTIGAGTSATTTISVSTLYGFGGFVSFTCSSPAPGINCAVNPTSIAPGATATVTINGGSVSTTPAQKKQSTVRSMGYMAGGAAASFLVLMVFTGKRRKYSEVALVLLLGAAVGFVGCGGSSHTVASSVTLATSNADVASGSSVTLTATVGATGGSNWSGTVNFYDGTTLIGSAPLTRGSASLSTGSLGVGIHTVTAQYSGEHNVSASTSNAVTQVIAGNTTVNITGAYGSLSHTSTVSVVVK